MNDFTSSFWNIYIAVIVIASLIGIVWLLFSQNKVKKLKTGEQVATMGHEWDGIAEYNNPLPRWWFYMFVLTVLFGVGYLILYPGIWRGTLGWTSHGQYKQEMAEAQEKYQKLYDEVANQPFEKIAADPRAHAIGQNLFNTYCIQCHGSDAKGAKGFPNLTDHDWLWGGDPATIEETIRNGRIGVMPAYGGLPPMPEETVKDVANYVISLNKNPQFAARANPERAARGKVIFNQVCFACHQPGGTGMVGVAPNLTDGIWLWGSREKDIEHTIIHGHHNVMPSWKNFLVTTGTDGKEDDSKLKILAAFVWGLSNNGTHHVTTAGETVTSATSTSASEATTSTESTSTSEASVPAVPASNAVSASEADTVIASTPKATSEPAVVSASSASSPASEVVNATSASTPQDSDGDKVVVDNGVVKFYFASGSSHVADDANKALASIVEGVKAGKTVSISGFHDTTGNAAQNAKLAKNRAQAVASELEKLGVPADKITLKKPESALGDGSNAEARRVEVTLQ